MGRFFVSFTSDFRLSRPILIIDIVFIFKRFSVENLKIWCRFLKTQFIFKA